MMTSHLRSADDLAVRRTRAALREADLVTAVAFMAMPVDEAMDTARAVLTACDRKLPDDALGLIPAAARGRLRAALAMLDDSPEALLDERQAEFISALVAMALRGSWVSEVVSKP